MNQPAVHAIRRGLIVSCQAEEGSPFNAPHFIAAFASAAAMGGAVGVRVRDPLNVRAVRGVTTLPIIALTKGEYPDGGVLITPAMDDVLSLVESGADLVALDATSRRRPAGMSGTEFLKVVKSRITSPLVADISSVREGLAAADAGADFIATTLSGYAGGSPPAAYEPDYHLIEELASKSDTPVIAEGRFWSPEQAMRARDCGAYAVCIGSAITRPVNIVKRFAESLAAPPRSSRM